jgi:hypothetical protein
MEDSPMSLSPGKKSVAVVLVVSLLWLGMPPLARAAVIPTDTLIELEETGRLPSAVATMLARADVRAEFLTLGVEPRDVESRLAALSPSELQRLDDRLTALPAGGDGLFVLLGVILVVLIVLEVLGVTNVFTKL